LSAPPTYEYMAAAGLNGLGEAVDRQGRILAHRCSDDRSALAQLLRVHQQRHGVAGLVNVPLADDGGLVTTARDAIRASFASAVDVLVLGRFIVSKDYWLIRAR